MLHHETLNPNRKKVPIIESISYAAAQTRIKAILDIECAKSMANRKQLRHQIGLAWEAGAIGYFRALHNPASSFSRTSSSARHNTASHSGVCRRLRRKEENCENHDKFSTLQDRYVNEQEDEKRKKVDNNVGEPDG